MDRHFTGLNTLSWFVAVVVACALALPATRQKRRRSDLVISAFAKGTRRSPENVAPSYAGVDARTSL
jgi:hypothetical protein